MKLAIDFKLRGQLMTCSKKVFRTLIDLNEKVNAEFGAKPFTRLAFEQMLVAMGGFLAEMFPESDIPAITGTYCVDTGVVDLPNLLPVIEKLVADNQGLQPIKPKDASMSQPITEQSVVDYLTKLISDSEMIPDELKKLFIGRVCNWESQAQNTTQSDAPSPSCPITITQEENRTFSVVIGGIKWPIGSYGTIGHKVKEGEDFQKALLLHGSVAHAGGPYVVRIPTTDEIWAEKISTKEHQQRLCRLSREFENAMKARAGVGKSLGQIAYEGFNMHGGVALWESLPQIEQIKWSMAGYRAYLSVSSAPEDIEKDIQTIAARKRLHMLQLDTYGGTETEKMQARATFINSLAGFPRAPEPKS